MSGPVLVPLAAPAPAVRNPLSLVAVLGTVMAAAPFFVLGLWLMDRPALIELSCRGDGTCELVRSGWLTRGEPLHFPHAELASARVERLRSSRDAISSEYRPLLEVEGQKQYLTFRWAKTPEAADALVNQLHAAARAPSEPLSISDDARRSTARVGGSFTGAGVLTLGVAAFFIARNRRRTA